MLNKKARLDGAVTIFVRRNVRAWPYTHATNYPAAWALLITSLSLRSVFLINARGEIRG